VKRLQPPTLLRLILLGFVIVSLPLVVAIVTAIQQLDGFARDNRRALMAVQQNASTSRALADRVRELERTARQYHALGDSTFMDLYEEHRAEVLLMFAQLSAAQTNDELQLRLAQAEGAETAANRVVGNIGVDATPVQLEAAFAALRDSVSAVVQAHNSRARELGNAMPTQASELRRLLISQAALVIPLSVGLAVLFGALISRPVRQIDRSIRSLGRGALTEPVRVSGTRDLEELGQQLDWLRARLVELEAQKAQFLRNVSHELKTPLTNIREGAELLLADGESDTNPERRSIERILRDNSVRLQQMIEELLRYGADGDLSGDEMNESVDVEQIVRGELGKLALTLKARSITLTTALTSVVHTGNAKRLRVIIDNLLSNALKYTPSGGTINVSLKATGGTATLDVRDSGPGIRQQDRPHVFDWFYTGPRPADALLASTGMGLAIAQEFARQHGGHIELIESSSGAHFRLVLQEESDDKT
jgi:two-component system sensor histidine kinase GlrK